jgi:hypothetical protein
MAGSIVVLPVTPVIVIVAAMTTVIVLVVIISPVATVMRVALRCHHDLIIGWSRRRRCGPGGHGLGRRR